MQTRSGRALQQFVDFACARKPAATAMRIISRIRLGPVAARCIMCFHLRARASTNMKRMQENLRLISVLCAMAFVWAIGVDVGWLPQFVQTDVLRWQVMLMAGIFLWVVADRLAELRCRCCGDEHVLARALFTRSHEWLCRRCLSWNPPIPSRAPLPVLPGPPLGHAQPGLWRILWAAGAGMFDDGRPIQLRIRLH